MEKTIEAGSYVGPRAFAHAVLSCVECSYPRIHIVCSLVIFMVLPKNAPWRGLP